MTKPQLSATPGTVNVGPVDVGTTSSPLPVSITNTGGQPAPLTVTAAPAGLIAATGCTASLLPSQSCVLQVTGSPTAVGPFQGSVTVAATGGNTVVIVVQGTGTPPGNFTVSPTSIDLGPLAVGEVVQTAVTVTANANLTALSTTVRGTEVRVEPTTSTCGPTLNANQSCIVAVRFTAGAPGASTGNAVVVSQGGVTKAVPITANVLAAAKLAATPPTAGLTARAGETSAPQPINIGNIGGMASGQLAVAIAPAAFKVVSETCSIVTLAAGATCSVVIAYAPAATATANETGTLTVTDRGVGASVATVQVSGVLQTSTTLTLAGGPSLGTVSPGAIGDEVVFTVTNISPTPSGALTAAVNPPANITISSNTCVTKATLLQAETCTIGLRLTPAAGALPADIAAVLTVTAANGAVTTSVTGAIVRGATLVASPTSVSFGSVFVNQLSAVRTVTITNPGATATGVLSVNLTGLGAAQVALPGNTCTAALAPAQSCTISLQYGPTDTTGVNGTITVTDGVVSASASMVGTGLAPTNFLACRPLAEDEEIGDASCGLFSNTPILAAQLDMGEQIVGYTTGNAAGATADPLHTLRVVVPAFATGDSGAITTAFTGTDAADFNITNNQCTAALNPGGSCTMDVTFKPAAPGDRTATLTVSGAKGGVWTVALKGKGLALVEIVPQGCANEDGFFTGHNPTPGEGEPPYAPNVPGFGLAFGQASLNTEGAVCSYKLVVRGATDPAASTTTTDIVLATSTPPDFRNVTVENFGATTMAATAVASNACDGIPVPLTPGTGSLDYNCTFYVQFLPQTSKSAAAGDKTATLTATGTAGGSASVSLTGTATGPLSIGKDPTDFAGDVSVGTASSPQTLTVKNKGLTAQGILGVALGGTNAADFAITDDQCTGETLAAMGAAVDDCTVAVIFFPTSAGAKTATLTVTAKTGGESATATLTGNAANDPSKVTVAPLTANFTPAGTPATPQGAGSAWATFTISNPAGAARTGALFYGFGDKACTDTSDLNYELFTAANGTYPAGSCGTSGNMNLEGGATCTIQARFRPTSAVAANSPIPRTSILNVCVGGTGIFLAGIDLSGVASPQLTLSGPITTVDNALTADFGNVAVGVESSVTITVTNNSLADITGLSIAPTDPFTITGGTCDLVAKGLLAGSSCTIRLTVTGAGADVMTGTVTFSATALVAGESPTKLVLNTAAMPVANAKLELVGIPGNTETVPIDFGKVQILNAAAPNGSGFVTIWFRNAGGLPARNIDGIMANAVTPENPFSVAVENKGTCYSLANNQLNPLQTCSVRLQFRPTSTTVARKTATFTLTGTANSSPVYLAGTAVPNPPTALWANVLGSWDTVYAFPSTAIGATTGSTVFFELHNPAGAGAPATGTIGVYSDLGGAGTESADFAVGSFASSGGNPCAIDAAGVVTVPTVCQVRVTFLPGGTPADWTFATKYRSAALAVGLQPLAGVIGQAQQPAQLTLTTTASSTVKVLADGTVDFGQIMESATPSLAFTITNIGEATTVGRPALAITGAFLEATDCAATRLAGTGGGTCATGSVCSCTVTVSVLGNLALGGTYEGAGITAVDEAAPWETSDESFTAKVKVVSPASVKIAPATTTFADTFVGDTATEQALVVSNGAGDTDSSVNRQDAKGVKLQLNDNVNFTLTFKNAAGDCIPGVDGTFSLSTDAGETCKVYVNFNPKKSGALTATVAVTSTVGGSANAALKGNAKGGLTITPMGAADARAVVGTVAAPEATFTVRNESLTQTTLVLRTSLSNTTAFVVILDECVGKTLASGADCDVTVRFTGTAAATAVTTNLTVSDGDVNAVTAYLASPVTP